MAGTSPAMTLAVDERAQLARAVGPAQLLERLRLDLTNALTRHAEGLADLLERVLACAAEAEAHAQDALLARRQIGERLGDKLAEFAGRGRGERVVLIGRFDEIGERCVTVLPDRRVERDRLGHGRECALDLRQRNSGPRRDFARRR